MGDILSLKLHRKRKARAEKEAQAAENRQAFGRTRHEQELSEALNEKARRDHDALKREE